MTGACAATPPFPALDDQAAVVTFLSDPASYGLSRAPVERVETHCSIVFLAGGRAYKLKRALRYAALDYTTLELRRAACAAELRLNRRTAPRLYLDILAVTRQPDGTLAFNGAGAPVDYVVAMRRFPQSDLFDDLAEAGRLTPALMHELGATIARFHQDAEITPGFGRSDALRRVIAGNDRELAKVASDLNGAAVSALSRRSLAALDTLTPLLDRRDATGKVRRCHGDLRLANICLYEGRPTLFDCIEFSDAVACNDVLHDLAFLLMDLHLRGRGDLGNAVFNAYLDAAPETEGLRTFPLFLALRAATRSYALAGSAHRQGAPRQAACRRELARQHISAGLAFLAPAPPRLVVLGGGSDAQRSESAAEIAALIPPPPGGRVLSLASGADVLAQAHAVLAAGCAVVIEEAVSDARTCTALQAMAAEQGIPCNWLWLGVEQAEPDDAAWLRLDPDQACRAVLARLLQVPSSTAAHSDAKV